MDEELLNDPTLADPDGEEESRYSWDEDFQRHVLALLVADRQFLLQSLDLIRPSYFTSRAHQKICSIVFTFFKKYHVLPRKDFIGQELKSDPGLKENKSLPYFLAELNVVCDYFKPGLEAREYLQDKITYFAKIQAVKQAFQDSLKEISKDPESEATWEKVYDKMRGAMTIHQNFEVGIDYFNTIRERYVAKALEDEEQDRFITGLYEKIDKEITGGGYIRGEIISVVAGSGVGKSVMLACITAANLLRNKKGVYISLELAERKVADRFDAIRNGLDRLTLYHGPIEEAGIRLGDDGFDAFNLSDIFEYLSIDLSTQVYKKLLSVAKPGARLAYWNAFVARECPVELHGSVTHLTELSSNLFRLDRAFFYQRFLVDQVASHSTIPD